MAKGRILLATGSRSLHRRHGGSAHSEEWAKSVLACAILTANPPDFVVHGGAIGPDTWAHDLAMGKGSITRSITFALDGYMYLHGELYKRWRDDAGPERHPLRRNDNMVWHVIESRNNGWDVEALALFSPWATTRGTMYTARIAEKAGISVTRMTCPVEYQGRRDVTQ